MNYISLLENFWTKRLEHSFTCNDIAVYFALADHCNKLGWKNPFHFSVDELLVKVRLKTKDPLDTARNRLKQAGLLDYKNGDGRGRTTQYWLTDPDAKPKRGCERGQKIPPLSQPLFAPLSPSLLPPLEPTVHKTKLNKTKEETTVSAPASALDAEFMQWQTWAQEHAPQVLRMKSPLTAVELEKLIADFGRALVLDVFEAMHNHVPLLRKYSSANLTARDWCKRRAADPRQSGASNPPSAATAPSLATKLAAQRHTKRV
jgi:hypothetical protein